MRKIKEPKAGWHYLICPTCKECSGRIIHFGGEKRIKNCAYCKGFKQECFSCFMTPLKSGGKKKK